MRHHSRGLGLTAAGERFLSDARSVLARLDDVRGTEGLVQGRVRVGCFVTLAPFVLPELVTLAQDRFPNLEIEIDEGDAFELGAIVSDGRVELAVGYGFAFGAGIRTIPLAERPLYVLLPAGHRLAGEDAVRLLDLAGGRLVLLDLPHSRDYFVDMLADAGLRPEILHRAHSYETVRAMGGRGLGFSVLNQRPALDTTYDGREVVARPITDDAPSLTVVAASREAERTSTRARAALEVLTESLAS